MRQGIRHQTPQCKPRKQKIFVLAVIANLFMLFVAPFNLANRGDLAPEKITQINRIKSAYLYNFLKYIDFPEHPKRDNSAYKICVLGQDTLGIALDGVVGLKAKGKIVAVQRLETISQAQGCHIVFISRSETENLVNLLAELNKQKLLTVSDIDNFTMQGGMLSFKSDNQRIQVEINLQAARQAGIKISALLLEIADVLPSD